MPVNAPSVLPVRIPSPLNLFGGSASGRIRRTHPSYSGRFVHADHCVSCSPEVAFDMDDRRFDAFVKTLAAGTSRRSLIKGLIGVAGVATAGMVLDDRTEAARRGFSGPILPTAAPPTPTPIPPTATAAPPTPTSGACLPGGASCVVNDPSACCSKSCLFNGGNPICEGACAAAGQPCDTLNPTTCCSGQCQSNGGNPVCEDTCLPPGASCVVNDPIACCSKSCDGSSGNPVCV